MTKELELPVFVKNRRQYGQWWDFTEQPLVISTTTLAVTAGANANDDTAATGVWVNASAKPITILSAYAHASVTSAGIDANNLSTWVLSGTGTIATLASNANFTAATPVSMGAVTYGMVAAGGALTLAITNGTNADLNSAACSVAFSYTPAGSYPARGLRVVNTDSGATVSIADGVKGVLAISPGAADNDEIYVLGDTELYKLAAGKGFIAEACLTWTEAATDDANVCFGFANAVAADTIVNDGGGPKATGDYLCFWKIDGGTYWYCGVQSNGTPLPTADTLTAVACGGAGTYQTFRIEVNCLTSTSARADFWIDDVNVLTQEFAYASATEMQVFAGLKNGSANRETLYIDYMGAEALR